MSGPLVSAPFQKEIENKLFGIDNKPVNSPELDNEGMVLVFDVKPLLFHGYAIT
jgi:hypothetical protein